MKKTVLIITTMILSSSLWAKPNCTPVEMLSGNIANKSLDANQLYRVSGNVRVTGHFEVPEGTVITFDHGDNLYFEKESYVEIKGTELNPVIFTSVTGLGITEASVNILGKAPLNQANLLLYNGLTHVSENVPNDKSGEIRNLHIYNLSGDDQTDYGDAALNFVGVGSETIVENIQVSNSEYNGVNFIGGGFDLEKSFLLNNKENNAFVALGSEVQINLMLSIQNDGNGGNGLLVWNNEQNKTAMPLTMPTVQSSSFIGLGLCGGTGIGTGIRFEHNGGGHYNDIVIDGFDVGLFIEDELSAARTSSGTLTVNYTSFVDNTDDYLHSSLFIWPGNGCGASMTAWIEGIDLICGQEENQFDVSHLGYDVSFCGDFCEVNFEPDFVLDGEVTRLDEPSSNSALDFRGAIQEDDLFAWILPCPRDEVICNPAPLQKTSQLEVYPNPAMYVATVDFEVKSAQTIHVRVMEMVTGRLLYKAQIQVQEGKQSVDIPTQSWKEGVYNVQIQTNNELLHGKLSVK